MYLTEEIKKIYQKEFYEKVLTCTDDFWRLDNELSDLLIEINKNSAIHSLYSKKINEDNQLTNESYLQFTYSKHVEDKLFKEKIPKILMLCSHFDSKFIGDGAYCGYRFNQPKENVNFQKDKSSIDLGCINNVDYFNINNIELFLISDKKQRHDYFWKVIHEILLEL